VDLSPAGTVVVRQVLGSTWFDIGDRDDLTARRIPLPADPVSAGDTASTDNPYTQRFHIALRDPIEKPHVKVRQLYPVRSRPTRHACDSRRHREELARRTEVTSCARRQVPTTRSNN
jgi:hypothetical protein